MPNLRLRHPFTDLLLLTLGIVLCTGGVFWWESSTVLLTADGVTRKVHPGKALTVKDLLGQERITLGPHDLTAPPLKTRLARKMAIRVTRVQYRVETLPPKKRTKVTSRAYLKANLRPVLVQRGYSEEETLTVRHTLHDGVVDARRIIHRRRKKRPLFTLTLFSEKSGLPRRTYDLLQCTTIQMLATAYYVGDPMVPSDTTYLGYKLRRGLVAVDPTVIPLKTRLYVKGYGYAYAADTGSKIKGMRIDLAVKDKYEEARFNHRKVTIYILEKAKTW